MSSGTPDGSRVESVMNRREAARVSRQIV